MSVQTSSPLVPLLRAALYVIACVAVVAGAFLRVETLKQRPEVAEPDLLETAQLYYRAIGTGAIRAAADGTLLVMPRDEALAQLARAKVAGDPSLREDPAWQALADTLETLYTRQSGLVVGRQAGLWNAAHALLAVRDDRPPPAGPPSPGPAPQPGPAQPAAPPPGPLLPGDRPNRWWAEDADGRRVPPLDLFVPEGFRFAAGPLRPGFSDWQGYPGAGPALTLKTVIETAAPATVTIQTIGRLDPSRSVLPPGTRIVPRCPVRGCPAEGAPASELVLPDLPAGRHAIALAAEPIPSQRLPLPDLVLEKTRADDPVPRWARMPPPRGRDPDAQPAPTLLYSADGHLLWSEDRAAGRTGRLTPEALDAGLLPVIGPSSDDPGGLAGLLAHRRSATERAEVGTTLDLSVQRSLNRALATRMAQLTGPDDPYAGQRIAAAVALDLDGAILGVAGYPAAPLAASAWDYIVDRAAGRDRPSALTVLAWGWLDSTLAPGSTLKLVLALTGLLSPDPAIRAMIAGCPAAGGLVSCAGLRTADASYAMPGQHKAIANFRGRSGFDTIGKGLGRPLRDPACEVPLPSTVYGLREAVRDSLNVWFVKLAEREGMRRVTETMVRLGFFSPLDLAGEARSRLGRPGSPGDVLHPVQVQSELYALASIQGRLSRDHENSVPDLLAATAIGQRLQASPLAIGRMVASVARGGVVTPRLLQSWNGDPIAAAPVDAFPAGLLAPLRDGLKAVPEVGTAAAAFGQGELRNGRCSLYGKTGTAELWGPNESGKWGVVPNVNTGWFAGWAEPATFQALAGPGGTVWMKPVVVVVFISHVQGDNRFGGASAAPVAAEFFRLLANAGTESSAEDDRK